MKKLYSTLIFLFFADLISAQGDFCLTDRIWAEMVRNDSSLYFRRKVEDDAISKASNNNIYDRTQQQFRTQSISSPKVIPTVIYIIHDGSPASNITMEQIQSQMDQLNQNFDPLGISFCYAKKDILNSTNFTPQAGDSAGVFRINNVLTDVDQYTEDAQLKALSTLPSQNYLRIFVVKNISPANVLGYAYYPGTSAALDGIVIRADVFGSNTICSSCNLYPGYNLGAALTHEAGHYLNLYHTFQGGCVTDTGLYACQVYGDRICDTPPTTGSFGCPSSAPLSCDGVNLELIENYMDYTEDACKNSFTAGQTERMDYSLNSFRSTLFSIQNLIATGVTCVDIGSQYANFYCANYNGCLNRPMTFCSLASPNFTYTWDFGDGTTATGDTVQHTFSVNSKFQVTLNAVSTLLNINVSSATTVFITDCQLINCSTNKWDFTYGYMDFSSGEPIATSHSNMYTPIFLPDFYMSYYRADSLGNALFHIAYRSVYHNWGTLPGLYDSSLNFVDSLGAGYAFTNLVPVPQKSNTFCYIGSCLFDSASVTTGIDTLSYSIIEAQNGNVNILPGKKIIHFPFPASVPYSPGLYYSTCAIPKCDGTKVWIVVGATNYNGKFYIFELDSSGTMNLHQTYNAPVSVAFFGIRSSPDGRKIVFNDVGNSTIVLNFDKINGAITGFDTLSTWVQVALGVFSPNSRFYYEADQTSIYSNNSTIYQYDLFSAQPYATRKLICSAIKNNLSTSAQGHLGPDGKLYFGFSCSTQNAPDAYRLAVINNPDVLDDGLNSIGFNMNGPDIKPANSPYPITNSGFGNFIDFPDAFGCNWKPDEPTPFSYHSANCYTYNFYSDECFSNNWDFGDVASGTNNTSILTNPQHTFTSAGNYLVSRTINGVTTFDSIRIETPNLRISETGIQNCVDIRGNYSIVFPQSGVNYSWTIVNGSPAFVPSATDIDIMWNDTSSLARIIVNAVNQITGCSDSVVFIPNLKCVNVSTDDREIVGQDILIQPNPSRENFHISSLVRYNGKLELKLINMFGETVIEESYNLNNEIFNSLIEAKKLSSGIYMLVLKNKNGMLVRKLIKE